MHDAKNTTAATNASGAAVERSQSQRQLPALPQQGSPEFTASEMLDKDRRLSALQEAMRSAMAIYQADDEDNIGEAMFLVLHAALARTAGGKDD